VKNSFLENANFLIGHPPCKIALLLLGSNSRYDRLPYSDLEIALTYGYDASVENNTNRKHAIYHYLASLIALLEIQIVYLGESHSEKQGFWLDKSTSLRCRVYVRSEVQNIIEKGLREKERHDRAYIPKEQNPRGIKLHFFYTILLPILWYNPC